ncbi:sulfurtransferase [Pontibacter ramchanderi]|uniref:Thiosulfate/3-mercaptopyruvate sulfurtransferase n=1 Tax=Pontibacter ramchanderi TaxID=1179743 RepID=A0A2N3U8B9_9BACT|nr:sulfurtransferase [Pontibacter ramchanderi]PKV63001.1 thiosulfate/3-mercaptopyruvate sulfurtransferase [Pontibacter ramchanderi]
MSPLIATAELHDCINKGNFILIDARSGPNGRAKYEHEHLAGALHVDLDKDLAEIKANAAEGGRHPLPEPEKFAELLGRLGITPDSHVVVYDDMNGANAASRFWWMLRAAGHAQVQVLDGGYQAALAAGIPVVSGVEQAKSTEPYPFKAWELPTISMEGVARVVKDPDYLVVDVRDAARYQGETEPIDLVAGHIPGAVNIPFQQNLAADGTFLSPAALREKYEKAVSGRDMGHVVVHCGSGVTACHTALAMDQAGLGIPTLYVGSWSEWSRNDRPIGTGA